MNATDRDRAFLELPREDPGYRPKAERLRDFRAVERRLDDAALRRQSARCMDCGIPFCHAYGCPLGNVIPEFNALAFAERWRDALEVLHATNPFPEFTGRICPAPCEAACVVGINAAAVAIRQVELEIIERAIEAGLVRPRPPLRRLGRRVAIVGSGPAGLAVADRLNRAGVEVTVYESAARPGGVLRYGVPDFKLEKWVIDRRVQWMREEGVAFECGVEIGRDLSHRYLRGRYDAIVLTGGAREPRDLRVPGRELEGIHFALPYLTQQNMLNGGETVPPSRVISARGKHVVVIGGGDTGSDCVGTALRQGAVKVWQFEILPQPPRERSPRTPWPLWPEQLRESSSHQEGGERRWCVTTKAFEGQGRVRRVRCALVEWRTEGGRLAPVELPGTEFTVEAELVLLCMGFAGPGRNLLVEELGLQRDERGYVRRLADGMTSGQAVFVAGDMTQGASLVVRAMADGIAVARSVLAFLERTPPAARRE